MVLIIPWFHFKPWEMYLHIWGEPECIECLCVPVSQFVDPFGAWLCKREHDILTHSHNMKCSVWNRPKGFVCGSSRVSIQNNPKWKRQQVVLCVRYMAGFALRFFCEAPAASDVSQKGTSGRTFADAFTMSALIVLLSASLCLCINFLPLAESSCNARERWVN